MGEVPDDEDAAGLGVGGDSLDVEELTGVELDAREEEDGGGGGVGVDCGEDVGGGEEGGGGGGVDGYHGGGGGEVVVADLGLYCELRGVSVCL